MPLELHSHTPWVVVLMKCADKWRAAHDGAIPKNFAEKKEFKALIKSEAMEYAKSMNFEEAINNASVLYESKELSDDLKKIFESPKMGSNTFWSVVEAIREFYREFGCLPVAGTIPDMTATPDMYLAL